MPFDKNAFIRALEEIRLLTIKDPKEFIPETIQLCAGSGIALALVREIKKVPWHGATKWLSASKAMILLNLRGKMEDQFWFSFFHDAGHVLYDSKKDLYINDGTIDDPREHKANEFAANILIPRHRDPEIALFRAKEDVIRLANELKISPGIVAGRFSIYPKNGTISTVLNESYSGPHKSGWGLSQYNQLHHQDLCPQSIHQY